MIQEGKIQELVKSSKEVFKSCSTEQGGILAADVFNPVYPRDARWYGYVWLRDASFVSMASNLLGMHNVSKRFFKWVNERVERVKGDILAHKYHPNGLIAADIQPITIKPGEIGDKDLKKAFKAQLKVVPAYVHFQPDQLASVITALKKHLKLSGNKKKSHFPLIKELANTISKYWKNNHFTLPMIDPWEEFGAYPSEKGVITYSLAMCSKGLKDAYELIENAPSGWKKMQKIWRT